MSGHDVEDDLDAFMAGMSEGDLPLPDEPPPAPADPAEADRLLRRIWYIGTKAAEIARVAEAKAKEIAEWREDRLSGLTRQRANQERTLEGWMRAEHEQHPKLKTLKLPSGELKIRAARSSVIVFDKDGALDALDEFDRDVQDALIRTTADINKGNVADACLPGHVTGVGGEAAPDGYRYHQAMVVTGLQVLAPYPPLFLPTLAELAGVVLMIPTRPTFSYNVKEYTR